jgi:hypothetical protein
MISEKLEFKSFGGPVRVAFIIIAILSGALVAAGQAIQVSVSQAKVKRGESVEVTIRTQSKEDIQASLLKPTIGVENLSLQKVAGREGVYRTAVETKENSPAGLYVVHVWTGDKTTPNAVGKASFRIGNIVQDFFVANYLDRQNPARDVENYLKDFRSIGGNFLVAHNLIIPDGAFYTSKIAGTDVVLGSGKDVVEELLKQADREGIGVLLSVSWDVTRNSPYKDRMKEIKSIMSEMYTLYRHHPSLAGFYSWQEGSGTYYAPFVREFSEYAKSLDKGLLTACAPHIDDPLLASYLSVIEELDMLIYQSAVMGSYRTDNRKKYPWRRVKDFAGLGAGAKRLQDKITLTHVELFGYLEKRQSPDYVTASYADIYGQILSAATVTETDGIALFTYHAQIYEPLKKFASVQKSREAVIKGLEAYQSITSGISDKPNPLALYIPYSDFIVERWSNYFLPGLDAFRALGVPLDILPYAPPIEESVYPYYPIHHNKEVLERLLKERTVLVLTNVSGFQQTDSDLIKEFVARGGVIIAFGEQIPMGRSYERKEIFGVDEAAAASSHTGIVIKEALGSRVKPGSRFALSGLDLPSWSPTAGARVIAAFEDNFPAVTVTKYGKGTAITILADARTATQNMSDLVRDALDYALLASGNNLSVDIVGTNEATDVAVKKTSDGFRLVVVNHNPNEREVILRPVKSGTKKEFEWIDLVSGQKMVKTGVDFSLKLKITGGGFRALEFRRISAY